MTEKTKKVEQRGEPDLPPLNLRTLVRAVEAKGRSKARHKRVSVEVTQTVDTATIGPPHNDDRALRSRGVARRAREDLEGPRLGLH
jgi:hypothetical protein